MENRIMVCNSAITVKEYQGKRVATLKDIDTVHQRPESTAKRNFNKNKKRLIEGEDYFVRNSYEAKNEFSITAPNGLTLITESGYLMLVKSFTDDLAWEVQRNLVNNYFRAPKVPTVEMRLSPTEAQHALYSCQYNEAVRQYNISLREKVQYEEKLAEVTGKVKQYDEIINSLAKLISVTRDMLRR